MTCLEREVKCEFFLFHVHLIIIMIHPVFVSFCIEY